MHIHSQSLSLCFYVCLSVCVCLSLCVYLSVSGVLFLSFSGFFLLSLSVSLFSSVTLLLSLSFCFCLSRYFFSFLSLFFYLCFLSVSVTFFFLSLPPPPPLHFHLSLFLSLSPCFCPSLCFCMSLSVFVCLSIFVSFSLSSMHSCLSPPPCGTLLGRPAGLAHSERHVLQISWWSIHHMWKGWVLTRITWICQKWWSRDFVVALHKRTLWGMSIHQLVSCLALVVSLSFSHCPQGKMVRFVKHRICFILQMFSVLFVLVLYAVI